jgi:hypothetical protein
MVRKRPPSVEKRSNSVEMDVDGGGEEEAPGAGTRAVDVETVRSNFNSGFTLKDLAPALCTYRDLEVRPQPLFSHCKIRHAHVRRHTKVESGVSDLKGWERLD